MLATNNTIFQIKLDLDILVYDNCLLMGVRGHRPVNGLPRTSETSFGQTVSQTTLLLKVLANVNSIMSQGKPFDEFCIEVGKILHEKFKFKFIDIWIRDERDPDILRLVTPESVSGYRSATIHEGIVGRCIRTGETQCVPDVSAEPDYHNVHHETVSELCVPLISDGNSIGIMNIETDTPTSFKNERALIELIAENLSHSLRIALLYKTEEQFHRLVEQMSEGVWVGDANELTIYVNPLLQKITGYSKEEFLQKRSYDFFDEPSKQKIFEENQKRARGIGGHYEAVMVAKNGASIPVLIHAVPFGNGGTMSTITDLRLIKNAEKKLAHTESFLASITQYCVEAIVGLDISGNIQSWNRGAEQMFGYKVEEAEGKNPKDFLVPENREESDMLLQEAALKGFVRNYETTRMHKNGTHISVSLSLSALRDENGKIIGFSVLYRDITAQKKWERELQDRFDKMQDAYKEMGKQRRYLDYLMEVIEMANAPTQSKKQIATFVVNAIIMITKVDAVTLRLLDPHSGKLTLTAQNGLGEEWWGKKSIPYEGSLVERTVQHGRPIKILDILSDSRYNSPSLARKSNLRSALVIPMIAKGEVLGSVTLYLTQENNLGLLDDEFIEIFVKQAAIALKLAQ